jgi:hypothetical protein
VANKVFIESNRTSALIEFADDQPKTEKSAGGAE